MNMVPPGPEPPRGVRGGRRRWRAPSDRAGALSTSERSQPGEALRSRQEEGACAAGGACTLCQSPPLPARRGSTSVQVSRASASSGSSGGFGNGVAGCQNSQCRPSRLGAARRTSSSSVEYKALLETSDLSQGETAATSTHAQYFRAGLGAQ